MRDMNSETNFADSTGIVWATPALIDVLLDAVDQSGFLSPQRPQEPTQDSLTPKHRHRAQVFTLNQSRKDPKCKES